MIPFAEVSIMIPDFASVKTAANHELLAEFTDGERHRFSMHPYLRYPAYAQLVDENKFGQVKVENGTVVWSDEIDIYPDTLYLAGSRVDQ